MDNQAQAVPPITPLLSNNQTSIPPVPTPPKSRNKLIVIIFILLLILITIATIAFINISKSSSYRIVQNPDFIPSGFITEGNYQIQKKNGKEIIVNAYNNSSKGEIVFSQQADATYVCERPVSDFLTDYQTFKLRNGVIVCAVIGFGKDRVYNWVSNNIRFTLKANNQCISDSEFEEIANSLSDKKVRIFDSSDSNL